MAAGREESAGVSAVQVRALCPASLGYLPPRHVPVMFSLLDSLCCLLFNPSLIPAMAPEQGRMARRQRLAVPAGPILIMCFLSFQRLHVQMCLRMGRMRHTHRKRTLRWTRGLHLGWHLPLRHPQVTS